MSVIVCEHRAHPLKVFHNDDEEGIGDVVMFGRQREG